MEAGAARGPLDGFAPAAAVARAVGELLLDATTSDAGAAGVAAAAGTAEGVGRTVEIALARLVLDAIPSRLAADGVAAARRTVGRRADTSAAGRTRLPAAGWWSREDADAAELGGAPWPPVPSACGAADGRGRGMGFVADPSLQERAWRALEREVEPASRRLSGGAR